MCDDNSWLIVNMGKVGIVTKNKTLVPIDVMQRALDKYFGDKETKLGCFGHSEDGRCHLHDVTHIIDSAWIDGEDIIGKIKLFEKIRSDEPSYLNDNLDQIYKMKEIKCEWQGFGTVSVNEDGILVINDDFRLLSFNIVPECEMDE